MIWHTIDFEVYSPAGGTHVMLPIDVLVEPITNGESTSIVDIEILDIQLGDTVIVESEGNIFTDEFKENIKSFIFDEKY